MVPTIMSEEPLYGGNILHIQVPVDNVGLGGEKIQLGILLSFLFLFSLFFMHGIHISHLLIKAYQGS